MLITIFHAVCQADPRPVGNKVAVVSVKEPFEQHEIDPNQKLCSQIFNQQQREAYSQLFSVQGSLLGSHCVQTVKMMGAGGL